MGLYRAFEIHLEKRELICFVGAGGKTTTMFRLAKELKNFGKKVLVITTTAIYFPQKDDFDGVLISHSHDVKDFHKIPEGTVTVMGRAVLPEGKLQGFDKKVVDAFYQREIFDYVLVEGDGAKRKSIKAPAPYEPVVPENTTKTVGVIGLDSLGQSLGEEVIHRALIFSRITHSNIGDIVDEELVARLIASKEGLFKDVPEQSKKYVLLNKVKTKSLQQSAGLILRMLQQKTHSVHRVIAADILTNAIYGNWGLSA